MVRPELKMGEPAKCIKQDVDGFFQQGDITWVNQVVSVPDKPGGKPRKYVMVQHQEGFIYLPAKHFVGLTEEEAQAFEKKQQEIVEKYEASN